MFSPWVSLKTLVFQSSVKPCYQGVRATGGRPLPTPQPLPVWVSEVFPLDPALFMPLKSCRRAFLAGEAGQGEQGAGGPP